MTSRRRAPCWRWCSEEAQAAGRRPLTHPPSLSIRPSPRSIKSTHARTKPGVMQPQSGALVGKRLERGRSNIRCGHSPGCTHLRWNAANGYILRLCCSKSRGFLLSPFSNQRTPARNSTAACGSGPHRTSTCCPRGHLRQSLPALTTPRPERSPRMAGMRWLVYGLPISRLFAARDVCIPAMLPRQVPAHCVRPARYVPLTAVPTEHR